VTAQIHIGTSGWHYAHWKSRFYPTGLPASRHLEYYAKYFDIVEINNTFYRLPTESAVLGWNNGSPPHFRFAVKGSRFLTHMKKLKDAEAGLDRFFSRVDLLGSKHWDRSCFSSPPIGTAMKAGFAHSWKLFRAVITTPSNFAILAGTMPRSPKFSNNSARPTAFSISPDSNPP
jgi:hypothetical protein